MKNNSRLPSVRNDAPKNGSNRNRPSAGKKSSKHCGEKGSFFRRQRMLTPTDDSAVAKHEQAYMTSSLIVNVIMSVFGAFADMVAVIAHRWRFNLSSRIAFAVIPLLIVFFVNLFLWRIFTKKANLKFRTVLIYTAIVTACGWLCVGLWMIV